MTYNSYCTPTNTILRAFADDLNTQMHQFGKECTLRSAQRAQLPKVGAIMRRFYHDKKSCAILSAVNPLNGCSFACARANIMIMPATRLTADSFARVSVRQMLRLALVFQIPASTWQSRGHYVATVSSPRAGQSHI